MDDPIDECRDSLSSLLAFCRGEAWKGYDPYDGLNSSLARVFPFKVARTALTQLVKRSPLNLRPLLGIQKDYNPKALALMARAASLVLRQSKELRQSKDLSDHRRQNSRLSRDRLSDHRMSNDRPR